MLREHQEVLRCVMPGPRLEVLPSVVPAGVSTRLDRPRNGDWAGGVIRDAPAGRVRVLVWM